MKQTREEYLRLHRELWTWLSENPYNHKGDWPKFDRNNGNNGIGGVFYDDEKILHNCFACQYTRDDEDCSKCLVVWPNENDIDDDAYYCEYYDFDTDESNGLYILYNELHINHTTDFEYRIFKSELAYEIANLPEREKQMIKYFIPRDNSKCFNEVCPVRTNCLRYMAETNKYQTISLFEFALEEGCEGYTIIINSDRRD